MKNHKLKSDQRKPITGETLFDLNIGNAAHGCEQKLTPVIVTKIGRKYFTCAPTEGQYRPETTYLIEDWRQNTEYCRDHKLYETAQEWNDEKEVGEIHAMLRSEFGHYGRCKLPLEKLRAMKSILTNDERSHTEGDTNL